MAGDPVAVIRSKAASLYRSITFITTYQCTAACRECCFESSPTLESGRLSHDFMRGVVDEAVASLPNLRLVVFSGGECFMLKEELFRTIQHAHTRGLSTRCVTNGYWGKTAASARRIARRLAQCGITEMNISTGMDHQEWVPFDSVVNAAEALVEAGIFTLVTIEKDGPGSDCARTAAQDPRMLVLSKDPARFRLQTNSWMPFHRDARPRNPQRLAGDKGCKQLFSNLVITPYRMVSACCGLTYEHIPEMRLGAVGAKPLAAFVDDVASDFLKLWIHVDGPQEIVRKVTGRKVSGEMADAVHICQACAILHRDDTFRTALRARYPEFVPEVVARFLIRQATLSSFKPAPDPALTSLSA